MHSCWLGLLKFDSATCLSVKKRTFENTYNDMRLHSPGQPHGDARKAKGHERLSNKVPGGIARSDLREAAQRHYREIPHKTGTRNSRGEIV